MPEGTYRFNHEDGNTGEITLERLIIEPNSPLYPSKNYDKEVFDLLCAAALDVSISKNGTESSTFSAGIPDLAFSTTTMEPTITYFPGDNIFEITAKGLQVEKKEFARRNKGGISSLSDLSLGVIEVSIGDIVLNRLSEAAEKAMKNYKIRGLSFVIADRQFSSYKLCQHDNNSFKTYSMPLPQNMLASKLDIKCQD